MFDYVEFERLLSIAIRKAYKEISEKHSDICGFDIELLEDMYLIQAGALTQSHLDAIDSEKDLEDDILFYKYATDEWNLDEGADQEFTELSKILALYIKEQGDIFIDDEYNFTNEALLFRRKIGEIVVKSLKELRDSGTVGENVVLEYYIRDVIEEEMLDVITYLNPEAIVKEYTSFHEKVYNDKE